MPSRVPPAPVRASRPGWLLRFTDDQRRRLAVKGRVLGRRALDGIAGLVTPDTILRWYRELIAAYLIHDRDPLFGLHQESVLRWRAHFFDVDLGTIEPVPL